MRQIVANTISSEHGLLHYYQYGRGEKVLLVFHGFGQNHTMVTPIVEICQEQYTIYSFDLPYHGQSTWGEKEVLVTKKILGEIFADWLTEKNITTFSVLGYSMGGKFALTITERFPEQVVQCILIAPDGLHKSPWYRLLTTFPVKSLFKYNIDSPGFFYGLVKFLSITKIVPLKLIRFGESRMATRDLRKQVYYTWVNFQKLYIDKATLADLITTHQVVVRMILGERDSVISPKTMNHYIKNIDQINPDILASGHGRLVEESVSLLEGYL